MKMIKRDERIGWLPENEDGISVKTAMIEVRFPERMRQLNARIDRSVGAISIIVRNDLIGMNRERFLGLESVILENDVGHELTHPGVARPGVRGDPDGRMG